MDEAAERRWSESAKIGIHSATGCCNTVLGVNIDMAIIAQSFIRNLYINLSLFAKLHTSD
jgi:hypothetical protein